VRAGFDGLALQIEHYRFLKPGEDERREGPATGASDAWRFRRE
jgi:hypothetical protein